MAEGETEMVGAGAEIDFFYIKIIVLSVIMSFAYIMYHYFIIICLNHFYTET